MKLSEAIRLGAMLKPQAFNYVRDVNGHTCAIGAVLEALGKLPKKTECGKDSHYESVRNIWPIGRVVVADPCGVLPPQDLVETIVGLNDCHRWTREAIASWVETIELQQAVAAVDQGGRIAELASVHARDERDVTPA